MGGNMGASRLCVAAVVLLSVLAEATANKTKTADPKICKEGGEGLIFPITGNEWEWHRAVQIVLYFIGLIWLFAGVSLYADSFMVAIEAITSKTRVVIDQDGNQNFVKVWNPTVANLTLMALGSSAPEILLSLIEIVFNDFKAGSLGPSTIVGSAAFNLFIILAICISAVPKRKKIWQHGVYVVTAVSSLFAYIWLVIIMAASSPEVIDVWEAVVTVLFFPILVVVAYLIDAQIISFGGLIDQKKMTEKHEEDGKVTEIEHGDSHTHVTESDRRTLKSKESMVLHINAKRGGPLNTTAPSDKLSNTEKTELARELKTDHALVGGSRAKYRHAATKKAIGKGVKFESRPKRKGSIAYDATQLDHLKSEGYDDRRSLLPPDPGPQNIDPSALGHISLHKATARVLESGSIGCDKAPNGNACVYLAVQRLGAGAKAPEVTVQFSTVENSAAAGADFVSISNEPIVFRTGEFQHFVSVEVIDDETFEDDEVFFIQLSNPNDHNDHNDNNSGLLRGILQCEVTIVNDDTISTFSERVTALLHLNHHKIVMGSADWGAHVHECLALPSGVMGWVVYIIMFPFNVTNCLIPPTTILGAVPSFFMALAMVGFITTLIGDMASLFGCSIGLSDEITAITFVALGTSLPDAFASRTAALNEKYADAAITNVTGSNSVNVFLGLGLSWLVASCYWEAKGEKFVVPAGALVFGVIVFTCESVMAMAILHLQRQAGGELGGSMKKPIACVFVIFWMIYIVLVSLKSEKYF